MVRWRRALTVVVVFGLVLGATACRPKAGDPLSYGSLEADVDNNGEPDCFTPAGWGGTVAFSRVNGARTGDWAGRVSLSARTGGERLLAIARDDNCSPTVTEGGRFTASAWYHSTVPVTMVAYVQRLSGWSLWYRDQPRPAAGAWTEARTDLPAVPPGVTAVSFGLAISAVGEVVTDDYALLPTDPAVPSPGPQPDCRAGYVGLTYDDGPAPTTPALLDALRAKDARATFFLIGNQIDARRATVARQVAEGHVIGNHSWTHRNLKELTLAEVDEELRRTSDQIVAAGAPRPVLFRPPYGETNDDIAIVASQQGMWQVLWHVDTNDWRDGRTLDEIVAATLDGAGPGRVVLFHDRVANSVAAVPIIVDGLRQRGLCPGVVRPSGATWTVAPG